ncbi:MAG TPA: S53 family peptidase [Candidatus Acidoferrum sp.]|nr:S53 family peptidase [Candidatus Acidoferrum sp.]
MNLSARLRNAFALGAIASAALPVSAGATTTTLATSTIDITPNIVVGQMFSHSKRQPPTGADCIAATGGTLSCYGPSDMARQYDFTPEYAAGHDGSGQTIVIFDSFGSPTMRQDLATFDSDFGLPAPPSFKIYEPEGNVVLNYDNLPSPVNFHNKNVTNEVGWAYETSLDVEYAHAMAPGANIALVVIPVAETQGVQGVPNMENAQSFALQNHLGTIWSNSWGTTEQAFHTANSIQQLNGFYHAARQQGVSAFFASGDFGVTNTDKQGRLFPFPTVIFPTSSPDVVSVGGTMIPVPQPALTSYNPEAVWNEFGFLGTGGGYSAVFGEPAYQAAAGIPDPASARGVPDVAYNSAVVSQVLVYESFDPIFGAGWVGLAGTSAAAPQWAAVDAIANQADGALGFLNPRLYQIYRNGSYSTAFHDITVGDNSASGVTGYSATAGWDPATGLGTPDVHGLVQALKATSP